MKKIIILAGALLLAIAVNAQNTWQVDGNNVNKSVGKIGSTNNKPLQFITNNQTHAVLDVNGNFTMYHNLHVYDTLKIGNGTFLQYPNTASQQGGTSDYLTSTHGRICFGNNALPPLLSEVSVGIGGSHHSYKLHIESQTTDPLRQSVLGFTNTVTGHTANDGFTIGLPTTGLDAVINQQEDADIFFRTFNQQRMVLNKNGVLGIGTNFTNPTSVLHVNSFNMNTGNVFRTDGRANVLNQWQMFTGNNMNFTTEKGKIFNYGNNPVFFNDRDNFSIQATAAHLTFHTGTTDANGVAAERMRIVGGTGPTAGFVGIGTRNPQSELHVHDGAFDT